jgi:hypothetical protein
MRWQLFLRESIRSRDWLGGGLLVLLMAVGGWLLALPFCPPVQRATLDRFHLVTPSFGWWAAQQAIPSMYNLENRCWIVTGPPADRRLQLTPAVEPTGYLNHFPVRIVTFADGRARWLLKSEPGGAAPDRGSRFYCLQSTYQGSARCSWLEVQLVDGQLVLCRLEAGQ